MNHGTRILESMTHRLPDRIPTVIDARDEGKVALMQSYAVYSYKEVLDERTFRDAWGVVRRIDGDGKFIEWVGGLLIDAEDPDEYDFPGVDRIIADPDLPDKIRAWKDQWLFVRTTVGQPRRTAW
jgi:hypothetical protein